MNDLGYAMDPVGCHAGLGCVMSRTYAVVAATPLLPLSAAVPALRIFPCAYITALAPSSTRASTTLHVNVDMSRSCVVVATSDAPACRTRPSGSTNMNG